MSDVFEHRGFMLDVSRHYMPPEEIRKLLDAAAILGLNRMHWRLTDDQGWRVEIRRYPSLTKVGSVRGDSCFGGTPAGERHCGFYTQEEIRELVSYAAGCGIEIMPEIEIPGHASAMLAAYPEFGCRDENRNLWKNRVEISDGIFPALVCAGSDRALVFLKEILDEIMGLEDTKAAITATFGESKPEYFEPSDDSGWKFLFGSLFSTANRFKQNSEIQAARDWIEQDESGVLMYYAK